MNSGQDLYYELHKSLDLAQQAVNQMAGLGADKANAEAEYRTALAEKMLNERAVNNTPVSILGDVCRGDRKIAQLKVKRDCADSLYDANVEALYLYKKRADMFRQQIAIEYGQS